MRTILLLLLGSGLAAFAQPVRIACGNSNDVTTADGKTWSGDRFFTGGDRRYIGGMIGGTSDSLLYRWSRVGYYGDFSYLIPVSNGSYQLTLKFAETQYSAPGARVFNVAVNGSQVISNLDLVKEAGYFVAMDRTFPVEVTNGSVQIQVTGVEKVGTLSAIELASNSNDPPPPTSSAFVGVDSSTQGNWRTLYGAEGYSIALASSTLPQLTVRDATTFQWGASPTDPKGLDVGNGARLASTWFSDKSFSLDMNLTDGAAHQVAIYALDPDRRGRVQRVEVLDTAGNVLDVRTMSGFTEGQYLVWNLSGQFTIRVTRVSGVNAVVSGIFLGAAAPPTSDSPILSLSTSSLSFSANPAGPDPAAQSFNLGNTGGGTLNWTASKTQSWLNLSAFSGTTPASMQVSVSPSGLAPGAYSDTITVEGNGGTKTVGINLTVSSSPTDPPPTGQAPVVSFLGRDTTRQGYWRTVYGLDGYSFLGVPPALPSYVQMSISGATSFIWSPNPSPEVRAMQLPTGDKRVASAWYGKDGAVMNFNLNFTDGATHLLALYASDHDGSNRSERVDVLDAATGALLDTQSLVDFRQGHYLLWNISGNVLIRVTRLAGPNAVVNGFFFGPQSNTVPGPILSLSSSALSFSAQQGGSPSAQSVAISNTGQGTLSWTASKTAPWISLSSVTGTAPGNLTVNVSPSGLAVGSYSDNVTVSGAGSAKTIAVSLTVTAPEPASPQLTLSSNTAAFTATIGGADPAARSISITNPSGTPLTWSASESAPWLSLSSTSGTTPGTLTLNASLSGLAVGTYTTPVVVESPGVPGSPQTINATFTVTEVVSVSPNPLAHWTFDSVSGSSILDSSPNNLTGTVQGGANAITFTPGPLGNAATFNGSSAFIRTITHPAEALREDITFTAWIKTSSSRTETLIAKYDLSGIEDGYIFEVTSDGYLAMHFGGRNVSLGTRDFIDGTNKINDGQWHHIVAIIRTSQDVQFYVDGGLSSVFYSTIGGGAINPQLSIGGPALPGTTLFSGSLDDLRIYPRALTTKEIADFWGSNITTSAGGELLYNGINMPKIFPPKMSPTQEYRTPYYINNPPRVIPIDLGRQLFVDDFLIESSTLQRTPHQAVQRSSPLFEGSPISGGAWWNYTTNEYNLWYWDGKNDSYSFTRSTDGVNWLRPTFPDVYVPNTNQVVRHGDTIWLDLEEPNPERRYKSFGIAPGPGSTLGKIYVYFSPDGIHWGPRMDYGIATISDRTTVFYNAFRKVWVNSDRGAVGLPATATRPAENSRSRYYSESKNLTTWDPANPKDTFWTALDENDPPYAGPGGEPQELYNLDAVAYESVLVGMFSWFHPGIGYRDHAKPGPILVEVGVGFSRDGFSWVRPTRESGPNGAFIPASNIQGTWNAYNTQSVGGAFLVVGDELWFYYSGRDNRKPFDDVSTYPGLTKFYTGLATLRRDGFYSMDAGLSQGSLTTRPVKFSGNRMFVNVNNPSGTLLIEVLDENNNVIPGFETSNFVAVHENKTSHEVFWNGQSIGSLAGRNVKFRFSLTNGSLYSFWVTSSPVGASNGYVAAGGPGFTTLIDTTGK